MSLPTLIIAGVELSIISWLDFDQKIEPISGSASRRMGGGALFKMTHYRKHRISLSASGWVPPALWGVDYDAPFEIELPRPLSLNPADALPPGWSARAAPWDEVEVTDQAGYVHRLILPKLTVMAEPPAQSHPGSDPSWELVCEEV